MGFFTFITREEFSYQVEGNERKTWFRNERFPMMEAKNPSNAIPANTIQRKKPSVILRGLFIFLVSQKAQGSHGKCIPAFSRAVSAVCNTAREIFKPAVIFS